MNEKYKFEQLVDLKQVRQLLESHHRLSGMAYGLFDIDASCLIAAGWEDICVRFHRVNPVSSARCDESGACIKERLREVDGDFFEYPCKNGMTNVAMPIIVDGQHLASFITGPFFYQDARPDPDFFVQQAKNLGFDSEAYLKALQQVPAFTRDQVSDQMLFLGNLVKVLSQCGLDNLKLNREIEERKQAEALLQRREQEACVILESAPDPITRYDRDGRRTYVNPAFEKVMGKPANLLLGKTPSEMPLGSNARVGRQAQQAVNRVFREGVPAEVEVTWNDGDSSERCYHARFVPEFDRKGTVTSVLSISRDISPIRAYQRQLHNLAFYDILTGLPNRTLFLDHLQQAVADTSRSDQGMTGLMLLNLDRLKTVNDSLGRNSGDELLRQVGRRLEQKVRDCCSIARLDGGQFAILLQNIPMSTDLDSIAHMVLTTFEEPFDIQGKQLFVTASIGIASCPIDSRDASELLQLADAAMYHAKARGRNHFQFSSAELRTSAKERLSLEAALCNALNQREFKLYYQPKILMQTGKLIGAEALLRWHHPELGIVTPDRFIGIAEDTGLIVELGEWVLREACRAAKKWNRSGEPLLKIAVNLSARQFERNNLVEMIHTILAETGCRPEWLELEVTESLLLNDQDDILSMLKKLCGMGVSIAIDDFGTGYSALAYLTKFPINTLKIDRSFIRDLLTNHYNAELVKTIVSLANELRLDLVAEGVETLDQANYLNNLGCHFAQGYLYGKPVPKEQFETMMRDGNSTQKTGNRAALDLSINYPFAYPFVG